MKYIVYLFILIFNINNAFALGDGPPADISRFIPNTGIALFKSVIIKPKPSSIEQGISILQTGPFGGSFPGQVSLNSINATFNSVVTGLGAPGATGCACVSGLQTTLAIGSNYDGIEAYGGSFGLVPVGPLTTMSDLVGLSFGADVEFTSPNSNVYGGTSAATVGTNGSARALIGFEIGVSQNNPTSSNVPFRYGLNIDNYGTNVANGVDTAISIQGGNTGGSWKTAITLTNPGGALAPSLTSNGNILVSEVALTIQNVFNISNVTCTGNILNSPGILITCGNAASGPQAQFVGSSLNLYGSPPTTISNHISYGGTVAASSNCGSLAGASGCVVINANGTQRYIPYY